MATPRRGPGPGQRDAVFHPEFREDLRYWVETERRTALRVLALVEAILRDPFRGLGKPEPLRYLGTGVWSRRLTQEHRLVYLVSADRVDFPRPVIITEAALRTPHIGEVHDHLP